MSFQTQVNAQQAPGVEGDFATANPHASVIAPEGGFWVAGTPNPIVGRFAWGNFTTGKVTRSGQGKPTGFIHREQQAQIVDYLAEWGNSIYQGREVVLQRMGDYYAKVAGPNVAAFNLKAFANYATGEVAFGAAGSTISGGFSGTAAQSGTTLTVSAVSSGTLNVGDLVDQASGNDLYVVAQLTGTPGGTGTYTLSGSQTVASGAVTASSWVETDWKCTRGAAVGELAVITL